MLSDTVTACVAIALVLLSDTVTACVAIALVQCLITIIMAARSESGTHTHTHQNLMRELMLSDPYVIEVFFFCPNRRSVV